jgi:hypothetical protein
MHPKSSGPSPLGATENALDCVGPCAALEGTNLDESAIIDHAIRALTQGGTVRINIPARIYRV